MRRIITYLYIAV